MTEVKNGTTSGARVNTELEGQAVEIGGTSTS